VFEAWHPKNHLTKLDPNSLRVIGTADNIAVNGEWSEIGQPKTGESIPIKGYWSAIKTREGDGWKIRVLTANITPAPPAPAQTK
jgi:hypothetical protein